LKENARWLYFGAWMQAVILKEGKAVRSEMVLKNDPGSALASLVKKIICS